VAAGDGRSSWVTCSRLCSGLTLITTHSGLTVPCSYTPASSRPVPISGSIITAPTTPIMDMVITARGGDTAKTEQADREAARRNQHRGACQSTKGNLCRASESRTNSQFSKLLSLFPPPKFPVPMRREIRQKRPNFRLFTGAQTLQGTTFRQISLYFPLLAGNLVGRLVRYGANQSVSGDLHYNVAKKPLSAGFLPAAGALLRYLISLCGTPEPQ